MPSWDHRPKVYCFAGSPLPRFFLHLPSDFGSGPQPLPHTRCTGVLPNWQEWR